jgi:glycosyltransferase involved in cell wall biosynthesis
MANHEVSILIPSYNTAELTKLCLKLIRQYTSLDLAKVIVIDNGSQDESLAYLRQLDWITLIERQPYPGESMVASHSNALNLGLESVNTPYVLSIHTDTLVQHAEWLPFLLNQMKQDPNIAGVGSWKLESKPFFKKLFKNIESWAQRLYYFVKRQKKHKLEGVGANYYYLRSHCALYRLDLMRQCQTNFSDGEEVAGRVMHRKLVESGHKMVFIASPVLLKYMVHLNHATTILNPVLRGPKKSTKQEVDRIQHAIAKHLQ